MPMSPAEIAAITALHDVWGLTAKEAQVMIEMSTGRIVPHERIRDIYCDNPDTDPIEARSCVKRIRIKLNGSGIIIVSHYGVGYYLNFYSAGWVRKVMRGETTARSFLPSFENRVIVSTRTGASA